MKISERLERKVSTSRSQKFQKNRPLKGLMECFAKGFEHTIYKNDIVDCCRITRSKIRLINEENGSSIPKKTNDVQRIYSSIRPRRNIQPAIKFADLSFTVQGSSSSTTIPSSSMGNKKYRKSAKQKKKTKTPKPKAQKNKTRSYPIERQDQTNDEVINSKPKVEGDIPQSKIAPQFEKPGTSCSLIGQRNVMNYMFNCVYPIINSRTISVDWCLKHKSIELDSETPIKVVYTLKNIPSFDFTFSCGFIIISPDFEVVDVPKTNVSMFKIENGQALVRQQLQEIVMGRSFSFYVPLGSTYSIKNVSNSKPLVLFFHRVCERFDDEQDHGSHESPEC